MRSRPSWREHSGLLTEAELVAAIRESPNYVADWSLVALSDDRVVGHVMVSYVTLQDDHRSRRVTSLAPLGVDPDFHGVVSGVR